MANVPVKVLFKVSNNIVSGDDSAKKGTQLSLIEKKLPTNVELENN